MGNKILAAGLSALLAWFAATSMAGAALASLPELPVAPENIELNLVAARDGAFAVADRFDPARYFVEDLVEFLDFKAEAAFEFVQSNIDFEPYDGVLRGAVGTLGAQAGNAYDRSLLLQRLLEDMGYDVRLAFGALAPDAYQALLQGALAPRKKEDIGPLADLAGFREPVRARWQARAQRDYEWLQPALARLDKSKPGRRATGGPVDHVWVQARLDGEWVDLDTAFVGTRMGQRHAEPTAFASAARSEDTHTVTISLKAEALDKDSLQVRELLTRSFSTPGLSSRTIYLAFSDANAGLGGALEQALGTQARFVPVLSVDGELVRGKTLPGVTVQAPSDSKAFFFAEGAQEELSAIYLDIETRAPGREPLLERRVLLDRLPAKARLAGKFEPGHLARLALVEGLPAPFTAVHQVMVSTGDLNPHQVANDIGLAVHFAGRYMSQPEFFANMPLDSVMWPLAMLRLAPLAMNERLALTALNDRDDLRFYIGEPRVYILSDFQAPGADGSPNMAMSIDLLHDRVQATASSDLPAQEISHRKVRYGTVQSAYETTLAELSGWTLDVEGGEIRSASLAVEESPRILTGVNDPLLPEGAPWVLLQQLQDNGKVVVSATGLAQEAPTWWAISDDGSTRAMLAPSLGGALYYHSWKNYLNEIPGRIIDISVDYADAMDDPDFYRKWREMCQRTLDNAYEAGGRQADQRIQRAKRRPSTGQRRSGGGTEYSTVLETSIFATLSNAEFMGLFSLGVMSTSFVALELFTWTYTAIKNSEAE